MWGLHSRAFFSRGFVEEVMAGSACSAAGMPVGIDHYGREFAMFLGECTGGGYGSGGCAIRDGFVGFAVWQSVTDMGNVETWELIIPMTWMGRRLLTDGCGWGKYRSGYPIVSTFMIYKSPQLAFEHGGFVLDEKIHPNTGMFGGYPGNPAARRLLTNANTAELIRQGKPLVHGIGYPEEASLETDVEGKLEEGFQNTVWFEGVAKHGDWYQVIYGGAPGGFGDPIKRDPRLVKEDLDNRLVTIERCRRIYCVEAKYDEKKEEWVIDEKKTLELRENRRRERLSTGVPAKQWWQRRRRDLTEGNLPRLLKEMYNDSLAKGKRWPGEFRAFWDLPSHFIFD
jgi:acetone carboxylase alpha subunit